MIIEKYRPDFFEGFERSLYTVNTKEELLESPLCKSWIKDGFIMTFSEGNVRNHIVAFKGGEDKRWYVVGVVRGKEDAETLKSWLPDFDKVKKE